MVLVLVRRRCVEFLVVLVVVVLSTTLATTATDDDDGITKNIPIKQRVADLLYEMSLEERVAQLVHGDSLAPFSSGAYNSTGLGSLSLANLAKSTPLETVQWRNAFQKAYMNQSRLKIPVSFSQEALHGGAKGGTVFPMPVTMGASWDVELVQEMYAVIAEETRAIGVDVAFAPVINLFTDPRFGRYQEGFSPNPTLSAHLATAAVSGLQGGGQRESGNEWAYFDDDKVVSLGKHYAAYGAAAGGLNAATAELSERTLRDVYLKPWRAFAKAGGRGAMAAHQIVNDIPCHANAWLLNDILREEFGFADGIVLSDCNDLGVLEDFRIAANKTHAAAKGLLAGVDQDLQCGGDSATWAFNNLLEAVRDGLVTEAAVNTSASRVLSEKFAVGLFDRPLTDESLVEGLDSDDHRTLARRAAQEGIVLMTNENSTLPLDLNAISSIAVIGPFASCDTETGCDVKDAMLGSYTQAANDLAVPSVFEVFQDLVATNVEVATARGVNVSDGDTSGIDAAVHLAAISDVAILMLGDDLHTCGEWSDRDSLDLGGLGSQLTLLESVAATVTPTIVVLLHGRPFTFGVGNAALDSVSALLSAGRPGESGGEGIVDILTGAVSPSGKLVSSWPRSIGQVGSGGSQFMQHVTGKWIANSRGDTDPDGRRYDNYVFSQAGAEGVSRPLFHFAHGLSFTSFNYTGLACVVENTGSNAAVHVTVDVTNSGGMTASEIVQVYVRDPVATNQNIVRFWKRLVGFTRVDSLVAGEKRAVSIDLSHDDLAFHDADMTWGIQPGEYTLIVAGRSDVDELVATFTL